MKPCVSTRQPYYIENGLPVMKIAKGGADDPAPPAPARPSGRDVNAV